MDKEKVLDYVMHSPGNTNRAVLSGMLDESGEGNNFLFVKMTTNTGATTYEADLSYDEILDALRAGRIVIAQAVFSTSAIQTSFIVFDIGNLKVTFNQQYKCSSGTTWSKV